VVEPFELSPALGSILEARAAGAEHLVTLACCVLFGVCLLSAVCCLLSAVSCLPSTVCRVFVLFTLCYVLPAIYGLMTTL
jgi:hypothetical protein